jgi:hypothetical protein
VTRSIANGSILSAPVMPELAYADVIEASDWICRAWGGERTADTE